jgi:exopolysaccharide biosynthesis polyprenyl glycosylphosphotransferase
MTHRVGQTRRRADNGSGDPALELGAGRPESSAAGPAQGWAPATAEAGTQASRSSPRPRWWRDMVRRRALAAADVGAAVLSMAILAGSLTDLVWALSSLPLWVLAAKLFGLYDRDHRALRHTTLDELGLLAVWMGSMVLVIAWLVLPLTPAATPSEASIGLAWVAGLGAVTLGRGFGRWAWRRATPPEHCLVIGDGRLARSIKRKAELFPDLHLEVADHPCSVEDVRRDPAAFVGLADRLVVASDSVDPALVDRLVAACRDRQVRLSVLSPLRQRARPGRRLGQIADLPVLEYDTTDLSRSTLMLKRAMDLLIGSLTAAAALPLVPFIVLAIKLNGRGPVLFVQARAGLGGRPFRMYKFRTMTPDAEARREELVDLDSLPEPVFKLSADPRVTKVGRILRRLSLDEIPQLINVLKGDMSLVGPRPEEIEVVERYEPEHRFRLDVKPGLTGPMQIYGRGDLTFQERLEVELDYVENLGLVHDLRILVATVPSVARGSGAS